MVELVDVSDVAWTDDAEVRTGAVGIEMVAGETNGADIVIVAATLVVTGG